MYSKFVAPDCIIPSIAGRLGNNMFMIAHAYAEALKLNKQLIVPRNQVRHISEFTDNIFRKLDLYVNLPDNAPSTATVYSGYFESEKYFKQYSEAVKQLYSPSASFIDEAWRKYSFMKDSLITSICVRRGDFLLYSDIHPVVSVEYIECAVELIPKTDHFFIFSDDMDWCRKNITLPNCHFISGLAIHEQMWLMNMCDNYVISNSTFSWWGAYLSRSCDKIVVAPSTWFGPSGPDEWNDIYCADWIKLPTTYDNGSIRPLVINDSVKVSVLTLTYGRLELLQEAICSFLNQPNNECFEMVVINDDPGVEYVYDHPNVTIINHTTRFSSIAKKLEWGVSQCKYDYIYRLDDDDLLAPWALASVAKDIFKHPGHDVYRSSGTYVFTNNIFTFVNTNVNNGNVYSKDYLQQITFPDTSFGEDYNITFDNNAKIYESKLPHTMIYRWGMDTYHVSVLGEGTNARVFEYVDNMIKQSVTGVVTLSPSFTKDYYSELPTSCAHLTQIADKFGIDKGSTGHNYTETYNEVLNYLRYTNIKMLEIGVADPRFPGGSIQMWEEYFPRLTFVGFDINTEAKQFERKNISIFIGDQNNPGDLNCCISEHAGDFDIILDDGSHCSEHIITSFTTLFPYVKAGGLYIIEDLDCVQANFAVTDPALHATIKSMNFSIASIDYYHGNKLIIMKKAI